MVPCIRAQMVPLLIRHRWSHCIRAYMFLLDSDTDGPCIWAQIVLTYSGTDGPVAFGHRWSCCIWTQMVPLHSCTHIPIGFGHRWSMYSGTDGPFPIQVQMVLLHLGTDGPIAFVHTCSYSVRTQMVHVFGHRWSLCYSGTYGPVAFGHRWSHSSRAYMFLLDPDTDGPFPNQAQMVQVHLGTDCLIAFVHTSSYGDQTQMAPCSRAQMVSFLFRHGWSCCIWAQMVPLYAGTDRPFLCGQPAPLRLRTAI